MSHCAAFTFDEVTGREHSLQIWNLETGAAVFNRRFDRLEHEVAGNNFALHFDGERIIFVSDCFLDPITSVERGGMLRSLELRC